MQDVRSTVSLKDYSTMRVGGTVDYVVEVTNNQEVSEAVSWAVAKQLPPMMIGDGSNIVWRDEGFAGLLIINKILGYEITTGDGYHQQLRVGAGENWDSVVRRTVEAQLSGIEALSMIPGTCGATPVQNVGAYGQEIAQTLISVEAYDLHLMQFVTIPRAACAFGYRTSRFKTTDRNRFLITSIALELVREDPIPPFYRALQDYFQEHSIVDFSPQIVRDAVIAIRSKKLPDPNQTANNGSFFANPVVDHSTFDSLLTRFPDLPHWSDDSAPASAIKLPAAWLIEQAGFKDYHDAETGMATWASQPLILINEHAQSTADVLKFKQKIVDGVAEKFGIVLEQEPELLP